MCCIYLVGAVLGLTALVLTGCGGSGNKPTGTTITTTGHPSPSFKVLTYNLYWWCMSGETNPGGQSCPRYAGDKGFHEIWANIMNYGPFDLVGFQECNDASKMFNGVGYGSTHSWKQGPADIGMGYDKTKFDPLGDYSSRQVAVDQWGPRYIAWIRLKQKDGGATIFFANTHGPLPGPHGDVDGKHGHEIAQNYIKAVADNIQPGDALVVTGDFNALPKDAEIWDLNSTWTLAANDRTTHFDHIYMKSATTKLIDWDDHNGAPSDHSILWADLAALTPATEQTEVIF